MLLSKQWRTCAEQQILPVNSINSGILQTAACYSQTASAPMSSHTADTPAPAAGAQAALQTANSPAQAANAPISSHMADTSAPAASAPAALQTADSSAQAAGAPASSQMTDASASAPSMEGYQGSDIQTQANNRAGVNAFYQTNSQPSSFQNSGQQQAPTFGFGLVGHYPDRMAVCNGSSCVA